jgi:hypothetical protein
MKKKKTSRKKSSKSKKKEPPVKEPEMVHLDVADELTQVPEQPPREEGTGATKYLLIAALLICVAVFAYYFVLQPKDQFLPGASVDETTFLHNFDSAQRVYIVMDVRNIADDEVQRNVLQCGVDFAASSGLGPKNATYFSISDAGCVTPQGAADTEYCFSEIRKGMTIYIIEGDHTQYYSNGIVVGVNSTYELGTCGIHRA